MNAMDSDEFGIMGAIDEGPADRASDDDAPDHDSIIGDALTPVVGFGEHAGIDPSGIADTTAWLGSDDHVAGLFDPGGTDLLEGPITDHNLDGIDDHIAHHGG